MYRFISILIVSLLLTACTKVNEVKTEKPTVSKENKTEKSEITKESEEDVKYYITGDVMSSVSAVTIFGKGNLLKGTILEVSFDTDELKPMKITVGDDGYFDEYIPRPSTLTTAATVEIIMKPDQQSEELKKKYGMDGENISEDYKFNYKANGKTIVGLLVQGEVVGVTEEVAGGNGLLQPVSR